MNDLFDILLHPPANVAFDGATYDSDRDHKRLERLIDRVYAHMSDGQWHTIPEISDACGGSQTSCSARLRDLRKAQRGGFTVQSEHVREGLWKYRLKVAG